jgi:succinate-acetate transporter protein
MAMHLIPHELYAGEVFFPPMLADAVLGLIAASITARLLNHFRVSRYFYHPHLVLIALAVIYTGLSSIFLIPA